MRGPLKETQMRFEMRGKKEGKSRRENNEVGVTYVVVCTA
jgi:hypothetical protein